MAVLVSHNTVEDLSEECLTWCLDGLGGDGREGGGARVLEFVEVGTGD
jgi:hypothetical protein